MHQVICYYLDMYRSGNRDDAFHGFLESDHEILPELMQEFLNSRDIDIRAFLLEVIWEHRQPSVIPFLGEALLDPEPTIWQEALNGLVTLSSPESIEVLRAARTRQFTSPSEAREFRQWLEEALAQAKEM